MSPSPMANRRVLETAQTELAGALQDSAWTGPVNLELVEDGSVESLIKEGRVDPGWSQAGQDRFAVQVHDGVLHVLGRTPRGLLQAVYALREAVTAGAELNPGFRQAGAFHFSQRIFHPRFAPWPGGRADVRFLSHLGATHCLVDHDWNGSRRSLQGYVTSPIFPRAVPAEEVAANRAGLRSLLDHAADHGLGAMLWLTELPCQGGPWVPAADREEFLTRFPAEVLSDSGTYEGRVLCFGHPLVREFYRDLLQRFFAAFPEIETFFVFGQDSGGEFCDGTTCPRCRGLSGFDQRDRLLNFLIEEGGRVRPGLRVLTTGWHWDRDGAEFLRRQAALPSASGVYLAAQGDGWQCERQQHDFLREVRRVCRERGQLFIGYDNFHWGDDSVHGLDDIQDFPLGIAAKLRRWHALEADGVFDHWGNRPDEIWTNSIACRDGFLAPDGDCEARCRGLALRQFGEAAGELTFSAWTALEAAHRRLSSACIWPPLQWPMWYFGRKSAAVPDDHLLSELRRSQRPERRDGATVYNPTDFAIALQAVADAWREAEPHYREASRLLAAAAETADDAPLFYQAWWNGPEHSPGRRTHLQRQQRHAEAMACVGREIGLQFGLLALWERSGHEVARYRAAAAGPLRETAAACREASRHFETLGRPAGWSEQYAAKAERVAQFLRDVA